ncbi:MAG TPA: glycosyltransferase family 4 protein [Trueperaceae bacterium]
MRRPRVLTWHVHGAYLYYLTQTDAEFILPVREDRSDGYGGRVGDHPWGANVREVAWDRIRSEQIDVVLCQSRRNYEVDRFDILSDEQLELPLVYVEHDPPREHPTDTRHPLDDPNALLVHVTHFNDLMWDSNRTPTRVIEHGVVVPYGVEYSGELERGLVVINQLEKRGRRLGADIFLRAREELPIDLIGMEARSLGGLGEVPHSQVPAFASRYRLFFNPIRYTSLGLAVCEAMAAGIPIVALATTEMATVIENDVNGYADTDTEGLIGRMRMLLEDPQLARRLGEGSRATARERFGIDRFAREWGAALREVAANRAGRLVEAAS